MDQAASQLSHLRTLHGVNAAIERIDHINQADVTKHYHRRGHIYLFTQQHMQAIEHRITRHRDFAQERIISHDIFLDSEASALDASSRRRMRVEPSKCPASSIIS